MCLRGLFFPCILNESYFSDEHPAEEFEGGPVSAFETVNHDAEEEGEAECGFAAGEAHYGDEEKHGHGHFDGDGPEVGVVGEELSDVPVPGECDFPDRVKPVPDLGPEGHSISHPTCLD